MLQLALVALGLGGTALGQTGAALSLADYMQRVVDHNEGLQARLLAFHAARSQRQAEHGVFEPSWVTSGEYVDNTKANTVQIERYLRTGGIFRERNQNYSSGLEMLTPLGTRVRIGATGNELVNNIQRTVFTTLDAEFQTSLGVTIEQPLLRGAGHAVTLAALRLAARGSDIAFQEYRRQLMQVTAEAELAYWQLYFAQQEVKLTAESLAVAETLVRDSKAAFGAGRGSNLDVLEAEAGLALRKSRESLARQKRNEAANRLAAFVGGTAVTAAEVAAHDAPRVRAIAVGAEEGSRTALVMNPDLLRAQALAGQERVRLGYARNQRLPHLDLKASYASSGLGEKWTSSWNDVSHRDFPLWTVSLEARVPLFGGVRGRNELRAAQLRLLQAERNVADLTAQLRAGLSSAATRVGATHTAALGYDAVVDFRTNLLQTRLQGRDVGRLDSRSVLEAEQDLFAARLERLQATIEFERALLELQVISGTLLQTRGLELPLDALETQTAAWMKSPGARLAALRYRSADFDRWPVAPAIPFEPDANPIHPLRLRLTRAPWK